MSAAQRVAALAPAASAGVREYTAAASSVAYLSGDHLGSAVVQTDANGGNPQVNLYTACPARCARGCSAALRKGEPRPNGSLPSPFGFTGQRSEPALGLYFYNARWYDPRLGRFIQADSIVPGAGSALFLYSKLSAIEHSDAGRR
ncbi:MAG: RHS repeat-associated core domain-containing protein [Bellilinea sp.]